MVPADDLDPDFVEKARLFDAHQENLRVLRPVKLSASLSAQLQAYGPMTYLPAEALWIRLALNEGIGKKAFISRVDAQEMAVALLHISWHPESYLLGTSEHALGMRLLTNAAYRFLRVATCISEGIDKLGLDNTEH